MNTTTTKMTNAARGMTMKGLYMWGYNEPNSPVSHLTNIIQCQCGNKNLKMRGLFNLVQNGHEVRTAQFDLFSVYIDGEYFSIERLEDFAK